MLILPILNPSRSSNTNKPRNKEKFLTWNLIRLEFVTKINMLNPIKIRKYIKCYCYSRPKPIISSGGSIKYIFRRSEVELEDLKACWKSNKKIHFWEVISKFIIYKFFKIFLTIERRIIKSCVMWRSIYLPV